ncbi:MAG TPA: imidazolonepropionase, partial [Lysinibacillus sp.]|nr:imidazolonepropionase [Lysinibacillus sp.]
MTILIRNANEVITLRSNAQGPRTKEQMQEIAVVENGCVLIEEDRIVAVGAFEQLEVDFPDLVRKADIIDATGKIVMPGLVDCHTHLVHGGTRE